MTTRPDGDGWTRCDAGHDHWGRHGAAGLLLSSLDAAGEPVVLLQRRAWWTHHGGTWGVPGGARGSNETPEQAALRETREEVMVELSGLTISRVHDDAHGGWTYWTITATVAAPAPSATALGRESAEVRWVRAEEVEHLPLHPGFAATWPLVRP